MANAKRENWALGRENWASGQVPREGNLRFGQRTLLTHPGSVVELEHLKIKTRLTNEKFASVKGECEI